MYQLSSGSKLLISLGEEKISVLILALASHFEAAAALLGAYAIYLLRKRRCVGVPLGGAIAIVPLCTVFLGGTSF